MAGRGDTPAVGVAPELIGFAFPALHAGDTSGDMHAGTAFTTDASAISVAGDDDHALGQPPAVPSNDPFAQLGGGALDGGEFGALDGGEFGRQLHADLEEATEAQHSMVQDSQVLFQRDATYQRLRAEADAASARFEAASAALTPPRAVRPASAAAPLGSMRPAVAHPEPTPLPPGDALMSPSRERIARVRAAAASVVSTSGVLSDDDLDALGGAQDTHGAIQRLQARIAANLAKAESRHAAGR